MPRLLSTSRTLDNVSIQLFLGDGATGANCMTTGAGGWMYDVRERVWRATFSVIVLVFNVILGYSVVNSYCEPIVNVHLARHIHIPVRLCYHRGRVQR